MLPVTAGHHAPLLTLVDPLGNRQRPEIILPEQLKLPFVLGQPTVGELVGDHAAVVFERHPARRPPVVIISVIAPPVVDKPPLVGETVRKVIQRQRQGVVFGSGGCKIGAVGGLLKPDELPEPLALVRNFERQPIRPIPT